MEKLNDSLSNSAGEKLPVKHSLLFKIVLITVVLLFLFMLVLFLSLINIINVSKIGNFFKQSKPNAPISKNASALDICSKEEMQYLQLTVNHFSADGIAGGTYQGILQNVNYNQNTKSATLQISNIANGNDKTKYTFSVSDNSVRIHDNITGKFYTSLTQLIPGQHITLTYNCDPQSNTFTIVTINIEQ